MSHGEDFDPYEENPAAHDALVVCECGREYRASVVSYPREHDSPGWYDPEPGEEKCPTCRDSCEECASVERDELDCSDDPPDKCGTCGRTT